MLRLLVRWRETVYMRTEEPHTRHQGRLFNEYGQTTTGDHHCRKLVCRLVPRVNRGQNVNRLTSTKFTPLSRLLKWRRSCIDATKTSCRTADDYQGKGAYEKLTVGIRCSSWFAAGMTWAVKAGVVYTVRKSANRDFHHVIREATRTQGAILGRFRPQAKYRTSQY